MPWWCTYTPRQLLPDEGLTGAPIPKFYFHLRTEIDLVEDTDGTDFGDAAVARAEAMRIARSLWDEMLFRGLDPMQYTIVIVDEDSRTIETIPFAMVSETDSR